MADNTIRTAQNKRFLQQFERQRLLKICNRVIDLRGRVAGECQAYTFGNKTHYLDDRGYLLARQLLDRFDGIYTIGVYEALLSALKTLKEQQDEIDFSQNHEILTDILTRDAIQPQLMSFDHHLQRKEARILFATPVDITIEDVLYHGSTIDITSSAIRIALKRAHALHQDDKVTVNFPDFSSSENNALLTNIDYSLIKIDHDELRTFAILIRDPDENKAVTQWLDNWTAQHNTPEYLDLDNELHNLASRYYLRLYLRYLNSPKLWLADNENNDPVKAFHLMPCGQYVFSSLQQSDGQINLDLLPINALRQGSPGQIVVIYNSPDQEGQLTSIAVPNNNATLIAKALTLHQQQLGSSILLLHSQTQDIDSNNFIEYLANIANSDESHSVKLQQQLEQIKQTISIADISNSCRFISPASMFSEDEIKLYTVNADDQPFLPSPSSLATNIKRKQQRFYIKTAISVHIKGQSYKASSIDASENGISFAFNGDIKLFTGMRINIDFDHWQSQTSQEDLSNIPFIIRNIRFSSGQTVVSVQRSTDNCSQKVNAFFYRVMERNKDKLVKNNHDIISSQEAHIFGSLLSKSLPTIPLYFSLDHNNKRILQAIATSDGNHAGQLNSLWLALAQKVTLLSEICKTHTNNATNSVRFGLYCYQSPANNGDWLINTDFDFALPAQKTIFISRALAAKDYRFYQCTLMPVQSQALNNETDLNQHLASLRNHSAHKVKQIREILFSLFAMGNLIDITEIIEAGYQS